MKKLLFVIGFYFLLLNLLGMVSSARHEHIYQEPRSYFANDVSLTANAFYQHLEQLDPQDTKHYVTDLTRLVSDAVLHYWELEKRDAYHIRLPWRENFLLRVMSYVDPKYFAMYEFQNHRRALARGIGLCSQHAIITQGFLEEQGIAAKLIELQGHVILTAEVEPNVWWLLDPDYGLTIPMSLEDAEDHPESVADFYRDAGFSDYDVDKVESFFATRDNLVYDGGAKAYNSRLWWIEFWAYLLKWLIPVAFIMPWLLQQDLRQRFCVSAVSISTKASTKPFLQKQSAK
jgi:hypothetical protein